MNTKTKLKLHGKWQSERAHREKDLKPKVDMRLLTKNHSSLHASDALKKLILIEDLQPNRYYY